MWHRDDHGNVLPVVRYADDTRELLTIVDYTGTGYLVRAGYVASGTLTETFRVTFDGVIENATIAGSQVTGNISGKASDVTGTIGIANGGTGSTTAAGARSALNALKNWVSAPTNSTSTGTPGDVAYDGGTGNLFLCYQANKWARFTPESISF